MKNYTKKDGKAGTHLMKNMVNEIYSKAEAIILATNNLNTPPKASLYETFDNGLFKKCN